MSVVAVVPVFEERDLIRARVIDDADYVELRLGYASNPQSLDLKWLLPCRDRVIVSLKRVEGADESVFSPKALEKILETAKRYDLMVEVEAETLETSKIDVDDFLDDSVIVSAYFRKQDFSYDEIERVLGKYGGRENLVKLGFTADDKRFPALAARVLTSFDNIAIDLAGGGVRDFALLALLGSRMLYGHAGYKLEYSLSYKILKMLVARIEDAIENINGKHGSQR